MAFLPDTWTTKFFSNRTNTYFQEVEKYWLNVTKKLSDMLKIVRRKHPLPGRIKDKKLLKKKQKTFLLDFQ